jgi:putative transposase
MAAENPIWGEDRIANELKMKLGIRVSPRTVGKYLSSGGPRREPDPKQRWLTFVRNHAKAIVACDLFVVVTASFRTVYVFVIMELGTRRMLHQNVTAHSTAEWTLQQFREALPGDHPYRYLIHDRAASTRRSGQGSGRHGRTRVANTSAGATSELCLRALRRLGPGFPEPTQDSVPDSGHRHRLPAGYYVVKDSVLGGLHHEYRLARRPRSDEFSYCGRQLGSALPKPSVGMRSVAPAKWRVRQANSLAHYRQNYSRSGENHRESRRRVRIVKKGGFS